MGKEMKKSELEKFKAMISEPEMRTICEAIASLEKTHAVVAILKATECRLGEAAAIMRSIKRDMALARRGEK